jgi:arabinofuranosyltransferase
LTISCYGPLVVELVQQRRWRPLLVVAVFGVGAVLEGAYITRVGGDWMHARLLLPAFFAFMAPVAVVPLRRTYIGAAFLVPWAILSFGWFRAPADRHEVYRNLVTIDDFKYAKGQAARAWFHGEGVYYQRTQLHARPATNERVLVGAYGVGAVSYALGPDVHVVDLLGLADPFTARLEHHGVALLIGHEKPLPTAWFVARYTAPRPAVQQGDFPEHGATFGIALLDDHPRGTFAQRVATARTVLRCPSLRALDASYRAPLTVGRFFNNAIHAFSRYSMRIPPEPADAAKKFC